MQADNPPGRGYTLLYSAALRFWPDLKNLNLERQVVGVGEVSAFLYSLPLVLVGIVLLVKVTDLQIILDNLGVFLAGGFLIIALNRMSFFLIVELRPNRYGSADGSLGDVILWSMLFLFGPSAIWLNVIYLTVDSVLRSFKTFTPGARWNLLRTTSLSLAITTLGPLAGLSLYGSLGGEVPLNGVTPGTFLLGMGAILTSFLFALLASLGYFLYSVWAQIFLTTSGTVWPVARFFGLSIGLPLLAQPLAILIAGLYADSGGFVSFLLVIGLLGLAILTRQMSWRSETNRQQSRQLEKLEALSRDIITAPSDLPSVVRILEEHIPTMFPSGNTAIWLFPSNTLYKYPEDWLPDLDMLGDATKVTGETAVFPAGEPLPWLDGSPNHNPLIVAPIFEVESTEVIGAIYLELRPLAQPWHDRSLWNLTPAIQSLAAEIASAIHQVDSYHQAMAFERISQELALAGRVQASFLPFTVPSIPGWQISLTLDPVGETSGDFFDIIPLEDSQLGIVVADVADKGVGPALFMALSRTLIRTYAIEFDVQPELVFFATNERILNDTQADLFVTAFYGVLDLKTGLLTYANAGHNPPYLFKADGVRREQALRRTGIPIGIEEGMTWSQKTIQLEPGDSLILYTDGIPDAQNSEGKFFTEKSLVNIAKENNGRSAEDIQKAILDNVYGFIGDAPQFDDITLIVLGRDT